MGLKDTVTGGLLDLQDLLGQNANTTGQGALGDLNPLNKHKKRKVKASQLYVMAGGKQSDAKFMGEVAVGESHCNNHAVSYTGCCRCIWQIHELHYAKLGYKSKEEFNKAITADPMECARAAVKVMESQGRGAWEGTKYVGTGRDCTVTIRGDSINEKALGAAADVAQAPGNIADALAAVLEPIGSFFKIITDPATWARVGKVLLGAIILIFAINQLSGGAISGTARRAARA